MKADEPRLLGKTPQEKALVQQWIRYTENHIQKPMIDLYLPAVGKSPYNKNNEKTATESLRTGLAIIEKVLHEHTFLVEERITLADIKLAATLKAAFATVVDAPFRKDFPNVVRHFHTVTNNTVIKPVFGECKLIETALKFTPPKKEEKPKAAAAPKAKALPAAAAAAAAEEEDEPAPAPKAKNPVDSLPPTPFNLEEFKRQYSNNDTLGDNGSLAWFYKNWDPKGYSIWKIDYKYNEELTQVFMSSNLIGGFFNRLEASRKYLMGNMGVYGENNNSAITGSFVARGTGEEKDAEGKPIGGATLFEVAPDHESYAFTKLDISKPEDKKFFEETFAWIGEYEGKKHSEQAKTFK